jgi:hypothetical protein
MTYRYRERKVYSVMRRACNAWCLVTAGVLLLTSCDNRIIERATSDYFPYEEGNWWRYLSNGDTVLVEVEPPDTLLQTEVIPVSFGGNITYFVKDDKALSEYVKIIYNFSGDDYTIIENFITRIGLPLIYDNVYQDSLIDSLNIFGQWVTAKYYTSGTVSAQTYTDSLYEGDVYLVERVTISQLISYDTTLTDTIAAEEYYAPDIGLIHFYSEEGEYNLIEYEVQ